MSDWKPTPWQNARTHDAFQNATLWETLGHAGQHQDESFAQPAVERLAGSDIAFGPPPIEEYLEILIHHDEQRSARGDFGDRLLGGDASTSRSKSKLCRSFVGKAE